MNSNKALKIFKKSFELYLQHVQQYTQYYPEYNHLKMYSIKSDVFVLLVEIYRLKTILMTLVVALI